VTGPLLVSGGMNTPVYEGLRPTVLRTGEWDGVTPVARPKDGRRERAPQTGVFIPPEYREPRP
jgi:hypothetical protein